MLQFKHIETQHGTVWIMLDARKVDPQHRAEAVGAVSELLLAAWGKRDELETD